MSRSINYLLKRVSRQAGFTIVEVLVIVTLLGLLVGPIVGGMFFFYGNVVVSNLQAQLALESQNVLRIIVEELRTSSGVNASNTISDPNEPAGGWNTSNVNLVLIIATPALDASNNFIINTGTGDTYQNEIIYYASGKTLYKRTLANASAAGNTTRTSCPAALATASCPADAKLSDNFNNLSFVFYDQDNNVTTSLPAARSIKMTILLRKIAFGRTIGFDNNIRITIRNSTYN